MLVVRVGAVQEVGPLELRAALAMPASRALHDLQWLVACRANWACRAGISFGRLAGFADRRSGIVGSILAWWAVRLRVVNAVFATLAVIGSSTRAGLAGIAGQAGVGGDTGGVLVEEALLGVQSASFALLVELAAVLGRGARAARAVVAGIAVLSGQIVHGGLVAVLAFWASDTVSVSVGHLVGHVCGAWARELFGGSHWAVVALSADVTSRVITGAAVVDVITGGHRVGTTVTVESLTALKGSVQLIHVRVRAVVADCACSHLSRRLATVVTLLTDISILGRGAIFVHADLPPVGDACDRIGKIVSESRTDPVSTVDGSRRADGGGGTAVVSL